MKRLFFILLFLLLSSDAWAVTKYLIPSGLTNCEAANTDYNPTTNTCGSGSSTANTDWSTAVAGLGASNTLNIRTGSYTDACATADDAGTSGNPTIIQNHPGEVATVTTSGVDSGGLSCVLRITVSWVKVIADVRGNLTFNNADVVPTSGDGNVVRVASGSNPHLENLVLTRSRKDGLVIQPGGTNAIVRNNEIHNIGDISDLSEASGRHHAIYLQADGALVEKNYFHDNTGYGIHAFASGTSEVDNGIFRRNRIRDFGQQTAANSSGILVDGDNNQIYENEVKCGNDGVTGIQLTTNDDTQTGVKIYNNTVHGCSTNIQIAATVSGAEVKNNLLNSATTNISNSGTATSFATNGCDDAGTGCTVVTVGFKDATNNDFSLLSTSTAINAGTSGLTGISCNGACDMGAHQTLNSPAPTCKVDDAAPNTIKVLFTTNAKPPMRVADVTAITTTVAAGGRTPSAPSVQGGGTEIWYTISGAAVTIGQAVTWAAGSTNTITDSALVGGTQNQSLHSTGTITCSNLVDGGAPSYVFTITRTLFFEFYSPLNSLLGARGVENGNATISQNGKTRLRYKIACTGAPCPSIGALVRYNKNAGAYTALTASFANGIRMPGNINHPDTPVCGATTTEILTSGHASDDNGLYSCDPNAVPTVELVQNSEMENAVALEFDTTIVPGDQYCFKVTDHTGAELTNPDPPCLVVMSPGLIGKRF